MRSRTFHRRLAAIEAEFAQADRVIERERISASLRDLSDEEFERVYRQEFERVIRQVTPDSETDDECSELTDDELAALYFQEAQRARLL
jgi:hypothetical protein